MSSVPIKVVLSDLWSDLSAAQKFIAIAFVVLIVIAIVGSWVNTFQTWGEIRGLEREAAIAKGEAVEALKAAEKIAREKVEQEKQLAEKEVKRDGKVNEVEAQRVKVADDRLELNRVRRERRGDNPSPDQLCAELDALGYSCG